MNTFKYFVAGRRVVFRTCGKYGTIQCNGSEMTNAVSFNLNSHDWVLPRPHEAYFTKMPFALCVASDAELEWPISFHTCKHETFQQPHAFRTTFRFRGCDSRLLF